MKWTLAITFVVSRAWALDAAQQNLINEYLLPKKKQMAASSKDSFPERFAKVKDEIEVLSLQAASLTTRMRETEPLFKKKSADFAKTSSFTSLYRNPEMRAKMVTRLSEFCCEMAKNPSEYNKMTKKVHERWEIEVDKYYEEERKKEKAPPR